MDGLGGRGVGGKYIPSHQIGGGNGDCGIGVGIGIGIGFTEILRGFFRLLLLQHRSRMKLQTTQR